MLYKYKAKNGLDFIVPGVGQSTNGILETDTLLNEAPALELVTETVAQPAPAAPVEAAAPVAAPGAVIGVAPQATAEPVQAVTPQPTNTETTL